MGKKFFLITQVFYPDEVSTAGLFTSLCEQIARQHVEVKVWCAQPSYGITKKQPRRLDYKGIKILYLPSTNFSKANLTGRIINYLSFSFSLSIALIFSKEKSIVFCSTNPPFLGSLVATLCWLKKRPFIYIIQDVFPDGLCRLGILSERNIIVIIWRRLNRFILGRCRKVIVLGRDMKDWLVDFYPLAAAKTQIIPIWQDDLVYHPTLQKHNDFILRHHLQKKFIIQYSGNMGLWNDMKLFAEAATCLDDDDVVFTFIGGGMRLKEMMGYWNYEIPKNVRFFSFQPKSELSTVLSACHIALVSLRSGMEGMAMPSKIMGILASGRPTIALVPEQSEISYLLNEEHCGIQVNPGDKDGFLNAIRTIKANDILRRTMGANARKAFENKYTTDIISRKYIELLK
jgi:glycosyltransferase involved in cell wall biosynthesis